LIYLVEHFYSIQGEGRYVGTPSLFFRFGGCNMRCEGFGCVEIATDGVAVQGCDTVYAVNKEHFSQNWVKIEKVEDLLRVLTLYELPYGVDVVLTGGEPLIYAHEPLFVAFLESLVAHGHRVTCETNATLDVDFEKFPIYRSCVFALSVKLQNSGEPLSKRVRGDTIFNLATNAQDAFFKFSIDKDSITIALEDEIEEILTHAPNTQVYCMPVGGCKKEVEANTPALIEFCKMKGFNFSDRLHIRIWDDNKGV